MGRIEDMIFYLYDNKLLPFIIGPGVQRGGPDRGVQAGRHRPAGAALGQHRQAQAHRAGSAQGAAVLDATGRLYKPRWCVVISYSSCCYFI